MTTAHRTENSPRRIVSFVAVSFAALCLLITACAYYNMLYNAKKMYKDAERAPSNRDGSPSRRQIQLYDDVIKKCQTMIGTYPKSRHVDDAMLLIAYSLHEQQRYLETAIELDSLEVKFPDTELLPDVRFLKGRALAEAKHHEESIDILGDYVADYPKHKTVPQAYYFLATSSMSLDREDDAVAFIDILEDRFDKNDHTFAAQIEVAHILQENETWVESREIYESLNSRRLPVDYRWSVWMGLAAVYIGVEEYGAALNVLDDVLRLKLAPEQKPVVLLEKAEAYQGMDSTDTAIATYKDVTVLFGKGVFGAEAHYRLAQIWEARDSLVLAKHHYEKVPGAYADSEFASESIRHGGNISRLLKLETAESKDSPDAKALRQFTMAELQFTQFEDPKEALNLYQELLENYPTSEYAPKAAYAVGYIYKTVYGDTTRAREAYTLLRTRYPDTPQAVYAGYLVEVSRSVVPQTQAAGADSVFVPTRKDTLRVIAVGDSLRAPVDTTVVVDSTQASADNTEEGSEE